MPLSIADIAAQIDPRSTVLFFGAGSSVPSGGPSASQLTTLIAEQFKREPNDLKLSELVSVLQEHVARREIVEFIAEVLGKLEPTRGLLAIPSHPWHRIFTTNWDLLVEKSYERAGKKVTVVKSNFDLPNLRENADACLVKIHGSITEDRSLGHRSSMVLSEEDYREFANYREAAFRIFESDIVTSDVVIVGHSLADEHIRRILEDAQKISDKMERRYKTYVIVFEKDPDRAALLERRGFKVAFGQIDELLLALGTAAQEQGRLLENASLLGTHPRLQPVTIDVGHARTSLPTSLKPMVNGRPASYADVSSGYTFARDYTRAMQDDLLVSGKLATTVVGASGVGKTTLCRQLLARLSEGGHRCWEHDSEHSFDAEAWSEYVDKKTDDVLDVLFVDNAHEQIYKLNPFVSILEARHKFKIVLAAHPGRWGMQIRNPKLMKFGVERQLSQLSEREIEDLVRLVDDNAEIRQLVEDVFGGYPIAEKKRRLKNRCGKDMFVCLKNIFASRSFDIIILEEFDDLPAEEQEIYRLVAAIESTGVRAHRQMILRLTGLSPSGLKSVLDRLSGVVWEFDINTKQGVYGWRGRHREISRIVRSYKFQKEAEFIGLLERLIDNVVFTYDIEAELFDELCLNENAINGLSKADDQIRLYERMIALAPSMKLPRHRIIKNLTSKGAWDRAEDEIRQYEADLRRDAFSTRSRILLSLRQVQQATDLPQDYRRNVLNEALEKAFEGVQRYDDNKFMYACLAKVVSAHFLSERDEAKLDRAMAMIEEARDRLADPYMEKVLHGFRKFKQQHDLAEFDELEDSI